MKKTIKNMVVASLLIFAGMPTRVQAADELVYSTPKDVAAAYASYGAADIRAAIVLINVGSGERINFGGDWGTQPMTHEVGMPLYLVRGEDDSNSGVTEGTTSGVYYKIGTNVYAGSTTTPGFIGYMRNVASGSTSPKYIDGNDTGLFVDRTGIPSYDAVVRMMITEAGTDDSGNTTYNISLKDYGVNHNTSGEWVTGQNDDNTISGKTVTTRYLTATGSDNAVVAAYEAGTTISETESLGTVATGNKYCQWLIATEENLLDHFKSTNNPGQTETAGATFLIKNQNFNRKNHDQDDDDAWTISSSVTIGNGLGDEDDGQQEYGEYWVARIDGEGYVYQEIDLPFEYELDENGDVVTDNDGNATKVYLPGWYKVIVKGFSTVANTSEVFICYGASNPITGTNIGYSSSYLNQLAAFSTAISGLSGEAYAAVIKQYDSYLIAANSTYETDAYAMLYIPEKITSASTSTSTTLSSFYIGVKTSSSNGITIIDDVQLEYGGSSTALVLDESWEGETGLSYINSQATSEAETRTLWLKRDLTDEYWASLVLPVNLTYEQVKEAFGEKVELCQLQKTARGGYDIYFNSVLDGLADTDNAIEAGKIYIIKPYRPSTVTSSATYTLTVDGTSTGEKKLEAPYFSIPLVSFTESQKLTSSTVEDASWVSDATGTNSVDGGIKMQGTYVNGTAVPQYSYAINANSNNWNYLKVSGVTSKGYRAWILTADSNSGAHPAVANLFIDDVQVTDGIEQVVQDLLRQEPTGIVYSLSGQMVSADGSLEGLPKGIYVKGGKKYVVK